MNKFELKGKVVAIEVFKPGKSAQMDVEVIANGHTEVIPVMAFNKLSDVVAHYTTIGDQVEVMGALRLNNRTNAAEPVAFKITKTEQKNTEFNKKSTKVDKKVAINGPIKKLDLFDGFVVNVYENLSAAAEDMKVKKSAIKKAIEDGKPLAGYKWSR